MKHFLLSLMMGLITTAAMADDSIVSPEGIRYRTGYIHRPHAPTTGQTYFSPRLGTADLPEEYDSRLENFVTPTKNQGNCGSCWAFAMTKAFEGALALSGKGQLDLSEQDWVSNARQHYGCGGGFMNADFAVDYGIYSEADCRYQGRNGVRCNSGEKTKAMRWGFVGARGRAPTFEELKAAIYQYKVLAVTVAAGSGLSSAGDDGNVARCGDRSINHMVTIVGWKKDGKLIMGNSWGTGYGDGGFAYLAQGCNKLASTSNSALYIVAEDGPAPVPPKVQLPVEVAMLAGTEVAIGVRPEAGVTYQWSTGATTSTIYVSPAEDTVYTLKATSAAGVAESAVKVVVRQPQ